MFILTLFLILLGRIFYLQILSDKIKHYAESQYKSFRHLKPLRGHIFDRNGSPLAMSHYLYTLKAVPSQVKNKLKVAQILSPLLDIPQSTLEKKLSLPRKAVYIKRRLKNTVYKAVMEKNIRGLYFDKEQTREYPRKSMAAHLIGFVDVDIRGLEGLEFLYENELRGTPGFQFFTKDGKSRELFTFYKKKHVAKDGYNIILNLDEKIQYIVEKEMKNVFEKYKPKGISVIVMEPSTGAILAMANKPHFDLNNISKTTAAERRNRAITDTFEPGSTFKIVTFSAALNEKTFKSTDILFCENGRYKVPGRSKPLHDHHSYGKLTVRQALQKSSNIGTCKIAQKIGPKKLYKYIKAFGFGQKTGIDLPGEVSGLLAHINKWSKASISSIPMGQEIGVNALQMVSAMSAIANKGDLMMPQVVQELRKKDGSLIKFYEPQKVRNIIRPEVALKVTSLLESVVSPQGTASKASIKGQRVAGKTGTAQKFDTSEKRYHKRKYVASFIGFFPVEKPQYCIGVFVDEPPYIYRYGSVVAAPCFKRIGEAIKNYTLPKNTDQSNKVV